MLFRKEVIETIRSEVRNTPVIKDAMYVCSERKRARAVLTLNGVMQRMKKHGFEYDAQDYRKFLNFLDKIGVGKADRDSNGKIKAVKDIGITLKSLGEIALNDKAQPDQFKPRNKFEPVVAPTLPKAAAPVVAPSAPTPAPEVKAPAALELVEVKMILKGELITVLVPRGTSPREISEIVGRQH